MYRSERRDERMYIRLCLWAVVGIMGIGCLTGCGKEDRDVTVLRVANSEEYIDEGRWDVDETIELEDGTRIRGINNMVDDFEEWYEKTYGEKVKVQYSTYGTNEELYNQMSLGNVFDLVCPSEYMIMKLMQENRLQPFSDEFFDVTDSDNYYAKGISPYIKSRLDLLTIEGEKLSRYGAGYMWGTMGLVYNPEEVSHEDVAHWDMLLDERYAKRITMKDSVRDSYFVALGIIHAQDIMEPSFVNASDYAKKLAEVMNDTSQETVDQVEEILSEMRKNAYSLETDSGKADLVTGKVVANMQWSGDAVYSLDQAEEDGVELAYAVPLECTNLWFDGWSMMKNGVGGNRKKQRAAEAFVNFLSRPDNVIRNMYYVGYTSAISGGDNDLIYEYVKYCYGTEADEDAVEYPLGYFFVGEESTEKDRYILWTSPDQLTRQLYAQYPPEEVLSRSAVMNTFSTETNQRISQMWTNIRCFDWSDLQILKH